MLTLLVTAGSETAIRFAATRTPRSAARFLLALRLLPASLAALFVLGLCVPSYLWLEPSVTTEQVGPLCVLFGILALAACAVSVARSARAVLASRRFNLFCASHHQEFRANGLPAPILVVESEPPVLAMSGLLRPRLLVSRSILRALSPEELDAALRHERSHLASHDNLKRFLFLLAPNFLPFARAFARLDQCWSQFIEWAADDHAAAGDPHRAAILASALVQVARLGSAARLPGLSTSLLACDHDLSHRVERLLHPIQSPAVRSAHRGWLAGGAAIFAATSLAAAFLSPLVLPPVHNLLERFLH
jgi:Zn-dependent protease with chaperone function